MLRKDPLFHFLLLGGVLFAGLSLIDRSGPADQAGQIVIPASLIAQMSESGALLRGRALTDEELRQLIAQAVRDEVYYRNALAMGLDVDDSVVRQRMIEKMTELAENVVNPLPADTDLQAWFSGQAERFRIPELVTFDHVFFSPSERGEAVLDDANSALAALQGGASADGFGDSTPLSDEFAAADESRVRVLFGDELTAAVFDANPDQWLGPFESDFGWHLVRVTERTRARDPEFAEVEQQVRDAYINEQLTLANAAAFEDMRSRFEILIEWEAGTDPEPWP